MLLTNTALAGQRRLVILVNLKQTFPTAGHGDTRTKVDSSDNNDDDKDEDDDDNEDKDDDENTRKITITPGGLYPSAHR